MAALTLLFSAVSSASVILMLLLLVSEFSYYNSTRTTTHLAVDTATDEDVSVVVDAHVTFFHATCGSIDVHFRDHKGKEVDDAHIVATRLAWFGDADGHSKRPDEGEDGNGCSIATTIAVPKVRVCALLWLVLEVRAL